MALVVVAELATGREPTLVLSALYSMGPLIACVAVPAFGTALVAVAAVVLCMFSGVWTGTLGTSQSMVRLFNVILIGVAAVVIAEGRVGRGKRVGRVAGVCEGAQRNNLPVVAAQVGAGGGGGKGLPGGGDAGGVG